ncbi:diguanylate cyclase (GGDEF)-like protein [Herbihabitans rhizosphaerae]|uniref:Diguanylate cyclase (GGDEF)-like protein n=1 Tax=Herbihabitans rhizosphaerae TaxID=1872711 RepID=A0A4Q7L6R4_9PSEU|nr:GGDEF domain-containing protein [Herbihabitans rhizosphaerae]RZS45014.1 diguanylate cyclase (GGDEF)-like protein [Herbihabitans rhizosphaerae]
MGPVAVAAFLAIEAVVAAFIAVVWVDEAVPSLREWALFAALTAAAFVHWVATRPAEERRRHGHRNTEHVSHTSVWILVAAVTLPVPLFLALIAALRWQVYLIARKPPHRFAFTTVAIVGSALGAHLVARAFGVYQLTSGDIVLDRDFVVRAAIGVLLGAAIYFAVQSALIGVVRGMLTREWTPTGMFGGQSTNVEFVQTLAVALLVACTTVLTRGMLLPVAALAVVGWTRWRHRIDQLEAQLDQASADALHDPLTGLLNRRGFEPLAEAALARDLADRRHSAVLMLDLDHFKQWNTRLGHFGGDQVLVAVADALRDETRRGDLLARWGGEEIAIMLPSTEPREAMAVAERIRRAVAALETEVAKPAGGQPVRLGHGGLPPCTISIGVAVSPRDGDDVSVLQEVADDALDRAKRTGRNRVVVHEPDLDTSRVSVPTARAPQRPVVLGH